MKIPVLIGTILTANEQPVLNYFVSQITCGKPLILHNSLLHDTFMLVMPVTTKL